MNIVVIGTGYVGLVSGACFSEFGFTVTCVDKDASKIAALKQGIIPIYEPGLDDLVKRNHNAGRLTFTTDLGPAVQDADAVFIAVGTPTRRGDGHADLSFVFAAAEEVAAHLTGYTVVVTKSTVPVGTGNQVEQVICKANASADFDIASNPEFLREGSAIGDFMRPDRVVVGVRNDRAKDVMRQLYRPLYLIEKPVLFTDLETAELIKYAANAFLAVKISYINQMADLCEKVGANVHDVAKGMGLDNRIGSKFLHPGPGYGGSCFPKDTLALVKTAESYNSPVSIVSEVVAYNQARKYAMADRVQNAFSGNVKGRKIAVLGLAFKPETDDMRESPSIEIITTLSEAGAQISAYDPAAMEEAKHLLPDTISFADSAQDCLEGADGAVVVTEWNEFRALTPHLFAQLMAGNVLVDLRNIYEPEQMHEVGLTYLSIGRP
ncbi:nucleotide sugar dehydrogenase [SAR116 cluster alpha proteobacterium HIMB100]|nr:nucleotide sugar dehydrogenase [SAR116 cluster alpha proteobacterium HIMB100]